MSKKFKISDEEIAAFQKAAKGTKRLDSAKKIRLAPAPRPKTKLPALDEEMTAITLPPPAPVGSETIINHKQTGVSNKILRNLRKGQYNVEAKLDLHGMATDEAFKEVSAFIHACQTDEVRVVLIVHGKGQRGAPILKNRLNHWLREMPAVLAFCSAAQKHGGSGAVYLMLRRNKGR